MKRITFIILIFCTSIMFAGRESTPNLNPDRIILNLTDKPATSIAVTWRTIEPVDSAKVQFALPTDWKDFEDNKHTIFAKRDSYVSYDSVEAYYYSTVIENLTPKTKYLYRVGYGDDWSEWASFTTASKKSESFKFLFFGDPQNNIKEHCTRVFNQAYINNSDAAFWMCSGDLISEPEDWQYRDLFFAGGSMFRNLPSIMSPGNHDRGYETANKKILRDDRNNKIRVEQVAKIWNRHFTLPENSSQGFAEVSYYVDYQGVRFIMIDTNDEDKLDIQAKWVENLLKDNPNQWTIVSFHHPFYSAGRDRDNDDTRDAFLTIFDKYNVDLVLTGHDHAYARSYKLKNSQKVGWNEKGTVYVVTVAGPKMYKVNPNYEYLMEKIGGNVQLYQTITVSNNKMEYKSFTVTGKLYDSFELTK